MHPLLILQVLALTALANGVPVLVKKVLGPLGATPLDGGLRLPDGRPLFGASKTGRGIVLGILTGPVGAPLVGVSWMIGLSAGAAAMVGDLLPSFLKRRLGRPSSSRASGLDQVPESLF